MFKQNKKHKLALVAVIGASALTLNSVGAVNLANQLGAR